MGFTAGGSVSVVVDMLPVEEVRKNKAVVRVKPNVWVIVSLNDDTALGIVSRAVAEVKMLGG